MRKQVPLLMLWVAIFSFTSSAVLYAEDLQPAVNLPSGEKVISGDVTVDRSIANTCNVNIATPNAIVEWANFSVGAGFAVNFNFNIAQPSLGSILNSVTGSAMSVINGAINSNGSVFLTNPNGIVFGQTATVNTASFLASTLKMDYDSFLNPVNGQYKFFKDGVGSFIKNAGKIAAKPGGYIALLSQAIDNSGTLAVSSIDAKVGRIVLASGEKMTVAMDDRSLISIAIDEGVKTAIFGPDGSKMDSAIKNSGSILADGGKVTLTAKTLNKVFDYAINNTGIIQANNLVQHDGVIELVAEGAPVLNTGTIEAGKVTVTVKDAGFTNRGRVITDGTPELPNGGIITINASTILQQGVISANAAEGGNAGDVSLVSEEGTQADDHSTTSAKAVGVVGNGGRVLIDSMNGNTYIGRLAIIDVSAGSGSGNAGSLEVGAFDQLGFYGVLNGRAPPGGSVATVKFVYHSSSVPPVIIITDKADYSPSGTPIISGSGFLPGQVVTINIFAPDGTQATVSVVADAQGSFSLTYTSATGLMKGSYFATGTDGTRSAVGTFTDAVTRYAVANGNWNATSTWSATSGGAAGASVPLAGDTVIINSGITVTVPSGYSAACGTIDFTTGNSGTASITLADATASLAVSGAVTIQQQSTGGGGINQINVGAGTFSAASVALLATTSGSRFSQILISTGTVTISGNITSAGTASRITFSGAGTLNAGGTFMSGTQGTFTASTGTVNFNGGAQSIAPFAYTFNNVTLSGSGAKTLTNATINGNLTLSGTATASTPGNTTVGGNLVVGSGTTFTVAANNTLTITGTTSVTGTLTLAGTGAKTFTGDVTINSGGVWNETGVAAIGFAGNFTNNATTFTANTGIHTFSGTTKTISGATTTSIPNVTITGTRTNSGTLTVTTALAGSGTLTNGATGTLNIGGTCSITTLTNQGTATITGSGAISTALANLTNTGTLNLNGSGTIAGITNNANGIVNLANSGIITSFNNATSTSTLNISDLTVPTITTLTTTTAGNTVNYNGAGAQTVKDVAYGGNLGISGSGTKTWTLGAARIITGNLNIGDGSTLSVGGAFAFTVSGTTTVGGGTSGALTLTNATGTKTFTDAVTINAGGTLSETAAAQLAFGNNVTITGTLTENGAAVVGIVGNLLNNGTYNASTGVHTFSGTTKTIGGSTTNTIGSVAVTGTYTNNGTLTVGTALSGTGTLTNGATGVLNIGGTSSVSTITNGGTVTISGTGAITTATLTNNATLNLTGTGTITAITNSATGTLNISATPTVPTITTLTVSAAGNTVNYNGAGAQTVKAVAYSNLTLSGLGAKTFPAGTTTVNGILSMEGTATTTVTGTLNYGGSATLQYKGSAAQTTGTEFPATFGGTGGVIINNASGVTLSGSHTITNGLTLTSGAFGVGTNTLTLNGAVSATSGSLTSSATGTVNYNQSSNGQNVLAANYGNLTFSNFNKVLASSGTIGIAGTFTPGSATGHTISGSTVNFNGSGAQTIPSFTFNNLQISVGGVKTAGGAITVSNFTISAPAQMALTVTAVASSKTYDGGTTSSGTPNITLGLLATGNTANFIETYNNKNVGTSKVMTPSGTVIDGNSGNNYTYTFVTSSNGTITAAPLTISAVTDTKVYDGGTTSTALPTVSGLQTGDSVTGETQAFGSKNVLGLNGSTLSVTGYTVNDGNGGANYTVNSSGTALGTITAAPLTISAVTDTKVYDGGTTSTALPTVSGLQTGDSVTGETQAFGSKNVLGLNGSTLSVTGYTVNDGNGGANYTVNSSGTALGTITAAPLTISAVTDTKVYDGGTTSTALPTVSGLQTGDSVTGETQAFGSKNVLGLNGSTLSVTGYTVNDGNGGANYTVNSSGTALGTITAAPLTISAVTDTKVYDGGTTSTALPTVSGLQTGDSVTGETQAFGSKNVLGLNGSTLSVTGYTVNDGNGGANYTVDSSATALGTITPAALTISAVTDTKVYDGGTTSTALPTVSGLQTGDSVTGETQAFGSKNVLGTNGSTLQVTGYTVNDGNGGANYTVDSSATALGTITPAALTISAVTDSKIYDGGVSSVGVPTVVGLQGLTDSVTGLTQAFASKNVLGTNGSTLQVTGYTVNDGNGGANYTVDSSATALGTITPAALTISAVTDSKIYDGTTSSVGVPTFTALAPGDSAVFTQTFDTKNAGSGKTLTPAGVVTDGNFGNNYSYTYVADATGVVSQLGITVTAVSDTKTYDGTTSSVGVPTFTALAPGDSAVFTQTFDTKNAGSGKTLTPAGVVTDGNFGNNYSYTYVPDATGVVSQLGITVTAVSDTKTYDGTTSSVGVPTFTALAPGDSAVFTQTFDTKNAGSGKTLTPAGVVTDGNFGNNYSYTYVPDATGVITQAPLTVSLTGTVTKAFDGTNTVTNLTPANYAISGFVGSESATITQTTGTYASVNPGTGINVTATLASTDFAGTSGFLATNYSLPTSASGNIGTITPLPPTPPTGGATEGTTTQLAAFELPRLPAPDLSVLLTYQTNTIAPNLRPVYFYQPLTFFDMAAFDAMFLAEDDLQFLNGEISLTGHAGLLPGH